MTLSEAINSLVAPCQRLTLEKAACDDDILTWRTERIG
jgi:hypothetical protein